MRRGVYVRDSGVNIDAGDSDGNKKDRRLTIEAVLVTARLHYGENRSKIAVLKNSKYFFCSLKSTRPSQFSP